MSQTSYFFMSKYMLCSSSHLKKRFKVINFFQFVFFFLPGRLKAASEWFPLHLKPCFGYLLASSAPLSLCFLRRVFSFKISSVFCLSLYTVTVLSVFFHQLVILTNELVILGLFSTTPLKYNKSFNQGCSFIIFLSTMPAL